MNGVKIMKMLEDLDGSVVDIWNADTLQEWVMGFDWDELAATGWIATAVCEDLDGAGMNILNVHDLADHLGRLPAEEG